MSESQSTKNMSKSAARKMRRWRIRPAADIRNQFIRQARRIRKSSGDRAAVIWAMQKFGGGGATVGRGARTQQRIPVAPQTILQRAGISLAVIRQFA